MLGHKVRGFKSLTTICLEDLVPADNFYRHVERGVDLSFVRELAVGFHSSIVRTGFVQMHESGAALRAFLVLFVDGNYSAF
jgi:hypothetical protein